MRKILLLAACFALLTAGAALADNVTITSKASFSTPGGMLESTNTFPFRGTQTITFQVAGKTCNLNGSARGSVPTGCNYHLTVAPDGSITGELAAGNQVCTQTRDIAASCK